MLDAIYKMSLQFCSNSNWCPPIIDSRFRSVIKLPLVYIINSMPRSAHSAHIAYLFPFSPLLLKHFFLCFRCCWCCFCSAICNIAYAIYSPISISVDPHLIFCCNGAISYFFFSFFYLFIDWLHWWSIELTPYYIEPGPFAE